MRLTAAQRRVIVEAIRARDPDALICLHGSRTDDRVRGGDIDLLVISAAIDLIAKLDILGEIHAALGDRRIDLTLTADLSDPFTRIAVGEGIRL